MMIIKRIVFIILCGLWLLGCRAQEETAELPTLVPTAVIPTNPPAAEESAMTTAVLPTPTPSNEDQTLPPTFTPLARSGGVSATSVPDEAATPEAAAATAAATAAPTSTPIPLDPEAWQLLLTAEENLRQLGSLVHERYITIQSPFFKQTEAITCTMRPPAEIYCDVYRETSYTGTDPDIEDFEFVQRGQQVWIRNEGEVDWTEYPPDPKNYLQAQLRQLQPSAFVTGAIIVGETTIASVPAQAVLLELDPITAVQTLYNAETFNDFLAQTKNATATATLWIGSQDEQMHKLEVDISLLTLAGNVTIVGVGSVSAHNQPVEVIDPTK
jgi:hypothetical protein